MPGMDGIQTLIEIKKLRPESIVIMMTGYPVDEMVHRAIEEKASDIIYKPFEIDKVLGLIKDNV
jgi:two-component system response regulator (stage 0 sporulation protein F)